MLNIKNLAVRVGIKEGTFNPSQAERVQYQYLKVDTDAIIDKSERGNNTELFK